MRRYAAGILVAATAAAGAASIASADRQPRPGKVRMLIHATDYGCAGQPWAKDTIRRVLEVAERANGSYRIREEDSARFVTLKGGVRSPGNCAANRTKHGRRVRGGVVGTLRGYVTGTVVGGTFDAGAACADPCTQTAFIDAYFGPDATFSCLTNSRDCGFSWVYRAKERQRLRYGRFEDRGTGAGTFLEERFKGDIASR